MGKIRFLILLLQIVCLLCTSFFVIQTIHKKNEVKEDFVELSNVKYGLFNVDEWKKILTDILTKKIEEFELSGKNRKQMKKKVSDFLYKVIGDLETRYYEQNSSGISGFFKNAVASMTGTFDKIKQDIPIFTTQILDFLNDPKNKKAVRKYLIDKLDDYADKTFSKLDYTLHDSIISKYKLADKSSTISYLNIELDVLQQKSSIYKIYIVLLAILTAIFILATKAITKTEFILLTSICFIFLILGLTLPMIEIDARISEIKLSLLGEQITFQNQVLYYKSKSILEVVKLMIVQGGFDLFLVGFLVLIFSVLFPLSKLISSIYLVSSPDASSNKIINFMVHKTGKWSMADVMVVAIFMSYIGFSGILTEQLMQLDNLSQKMEVLTTNKSSLQIGFFAFTAFALLSLLTTNKLKKHLKNFENE